MFNRQFFVFFAFALIASMVVMPASAAERVEHRTETASYTDTVLIEGEERACLEGADRLILNVNDVSDIAEVVSGPNAGSMRIRISFDGTFQGFTGDMPTITGMFQGHFSLKIHRGDRLTSFSEHVSATTSSGERVKYLIHSHFTIRDGELTRDVYKLNCIQ
jgi:hypothetical protein